jgi:NAD(P)-dependent dehydrogenase (short-subunit alcohol dehydrogenase family)
MKVEPQGFMALITGAGRGIGQATAFALAENGAVVAVNDVDSSGEDTAEEIRRRGARAKFYRANVSDSDAVNAMVAAVEEQLGPIEILVNNAGVNLGPQRYPVHEFPDSDWQRITRVDLDGAFYCSRAVSSRMVKRRRGVIINIGSIAGVVPLRVQSAFDAAKAGVHNLTRCQALELGPYGIRVNAIAPGSILTEGTRQLFYNEANKQKAESLLSHIPLGRPGDVEDIAKAVLYLVYRFTKQ